MLLPAQIYNPYKCQNIYTFHFSICNMSSRKYEQQPMKLMTAIHRKRKQKCFWLGSSNCSISRKSKNRRATDGEMAYRSKWSKRNKLQYLMCILSIITTCQLIYSYSHHISRITKASQRRLAGFLLQFSRMSLKPKTNVRTRSLHVTDIGSHIPNLEVMFLKNMHFFLFG